MAEPDVGPLHRPDGGPGEIPAAILPIATPLAVSGDGEAAAALLLAEERLSVSKRRVSAGRVRVATRTDVVEEIAEAELHRYRVEVTRVAAGRFVDVAPQARSEGGVTIIPVVEERLVTVKRLYLTEELHIRHVVEREIVREPVTLRRQTAVVERSPSDGSPATMREPQ